MASIPSLLLTIHLRLTPEQHAYLAAEAHDLDIAAQIVAAWICEDAVAEAARDAGYVAPAKRPLRRVRRRTGAVLRLLPTIEMEG